MTALLTGRPLTFAGGVAAACDATVNGRPMSMELCQVAWQVYGGVLPGNYHVDEAGNWVNLDNPRHAGNFYRDAQTPRAGGGSGGLTRTPFGHVGDGYYFDPESGVSIGP
ncbi:MAG TPA: hypothetical protein VFV80_00270 [Geminicoccaceae bacterium]|nr:hypothetical protein [Geminicoccaceae bacterium]